MRRAKTAGALPLSSIDNISLQSSTDDTTILSSDDSTMDLTTTLPSSITLTPRRSLKAKRSLVWRYFKVLSDKSLNAECMLCSSVVTRTSSSTSNLLHHIQTRHDNEFQIVNKSMKSRTPELVQRLPLSSDRSAHLTKLAANLIIYNLLPLSIVESPQLQMIFQEAEPSFVLPKRKYFVGNVLNHMYTETREKVQRELQYAIGKLLMSIWYLFNFLFDVLGVCLTTDIWTSQANQAYMTVTAHFVVPVDNRLKCYVLETTEFPGNHTAERIVDRLENICIDWSILDKVVCLVSDTCNVMRKVGVDFSKGKYFTLRTRYICRFSRMVWLYGSSY